MSCERSDYRAGASTWRAIGFFDRVIITHIGRTSVTVDVQLYAKGNPGR
jgi:hypothetical protein